MMKLLKILQEKLLEIYKPKSYCVEKQKFTNFNNYDGNVEGYRSALENDYSEKTNLIVALIVLLKYLDIS